MSVIELLLPALELCLLYNLRKLSNGGSFWMDSLNTFSNFEEDARFRQSFNR